MQYSDALDQVCGRAAASLGRWISLMDGPSFSEGSQQQQRAARALGGCRFLSSPPAVGGQVKSVRERLEKRKAKVWARVRQHCKHRDWDAGGDTTSTFAWMERAEKTKRGLQLTTGWRGGVCLLIYCSTGFPEGEIHQHLQVQWRAATKRATRAN